MTEIDKATIISDFLTAEGYRPTRDSDGDVTFKREGKTYFIGVDAEDPEFFRLVLPNFWPIESEDERARVIEASTHATAQTKVAKVFPVRDNTWASIELFCNPIDNFQSVFERSLSALSAAVVTFVAKMRESQP